MSERPIGPIGEILRHWEEVWIAVILLGSIAAAVQALDHAQRPTLRHAVGLITRVLVVSVTAGAVVMLLIYDLSLHPATKGGICALGAVFGELTLEALYQAVIRPFLIRIGAVLGKGK